MLEYCILLIVKEKPAYTTEIIEALHKAEMIVVEGTIYPILSRMKAAEMLSYYWQESTSGPPRKYFQITEKGKQLLGEMQREWQQLSKSINDLQRTKQ